MAVVDDTVLEVVEVVAESLSNSNFCNAFIQQRCMGFQYNKKIMPFYHSILCKNLPNDVQFLSPDIAPTRVRAPLFDVFKRHLNRFVSPA